MSQSSEESPRFYRNPVHNRSFPDPYVLKHGGEFWAYCTDFREDGRCFGVMRSHDLVHWTEICGAMDPLPGGFGCYWAPEVSYLNGRFYMYYSVGNEERMEIRVAVAEHPDGPFTDAGRGLTREDFAIDAHLFQDDDGSLYFFYATDFLEHSFIGTGTVYDRMIDPLTLAGAPQPVARARYDWQVYDPRRESKGGVRWHTVEGPFVLKHKGLYYEMFSGGNWQNLSYGVGYATSRTINSAAEWDQYADGERALPILRTVPGTVIGPGHNSVVRGPDNRQLFCVYHRWTPDASMRVLAIDRMEFVGGRLIVLGPTSEPQPMPILPSVRGFAPAGNGARWHFSGEYWDVTERTASQPSIESFCSAGLRLEAPAFLAEIQFHALKNVGEGGYGVILNSHAGPLLRLGFSPDGRVMIVGRDGGPDGWRQEQIHLPPGFDPHADHLVRLELNHGAVAVAIDGHSRHWNGRLHGVPTELTLFTERTAVAFTGFELTYGYEDLFMEDGAPETFGWESRDGARGWSVEGREMRRERFELESVLEKRVGFGSYEAIVNARLGDGGDSGGCYGFLPAAGPDAPGPLLRVERAGEGWQITVDGDAGTEAMRLPAEFDPSIHQHFRFRKEGTRLAVWWEGTQLGQMDVASEAAHLGLYARGAAVGFDMVRVTAISR